MVIPEDEMHFQYEEYDDEDYPEYKAYIDTEDYSNTILFKTNVYSTVDEAKSHYNVTKQSYDEPNTFGTGDQAAKQDDGDHAETIMRVSNAVGHVVSYVPDEAPEDPEDRRFQPRTRATGYARELRDYWGGTSSFEDHPGFCREEVKALQQPDEPDENE